MASNSTIDGLVSGLDTTNVIKQLIAVEAQPQTVLKNRQSAAKTDATAYRSANTRFDSLRSAAEALTAAGAYQATKATSSAASVSVSASATATPASLTFNVDRVAARHMVISDRTWTATSDAFGGSGSTLSLPNADGTAGSVATTGTLAETVAAINGGTYGVTAAAVQVGATTFKLQLTAKDSGAAKVFTAAAGADTFGTTVQQGIDAQVTVGSGGGSYQATSSSNTFTGLLDGVTLTVSTAAAATPVTVSVSSDPSAISGKVKTLIESANEALKTITSLTDYKSTTALLKGDSTLRGLANQILDAVSSAIGGRSAAEVGISLTRTGSLTFDAAKFSTALAADPALAQKLVGGTLAKAEVIADPMATPPVVGSPAVPAVDGLAARMLTIAKGASDATTGSLTLLAKNKDSAATDFQGRIDAWDVRLASRTLSLEKYYTALETSLGKLKNQSSWLDGQLANLPSWSRR
ncbi:flagellar filament capping protein FliD [Modestobacter sp. I12A-02628]|uniref:Flagellar hook-associated protein 2 n=1 Tax=Goekera deserti TaxID=2497753 RepID=A0A7K3WGP2_9ACTN|nr:flagellar filament capping protein FliD [Goekera deserti]MPQ99507.1 flagellar filament capping protein FliD [Goekera deserti]NDI48994.1 flagellar filament capping protein FliD [Goekera deserti]NEL55536.1 flagellar filament capping protein FliD [Goekera deserti]